MKHTDCGTKYEVLATGKLKEPQELEPDKHGNVFTEPVLFGFTEAFENIKTADGTVYKGFIVHVYCEKIEDAKNPA